MKKNQFLKCTIRYSYWFVLALALSYVLASIMVYGNTLIGTAIDQLLGNEAVKFDTFLAQLIIMILLGFVTAFLKSVAISKFSIKVQTDYKDIVAKKLYRLEYKYFDDNGSAAIINKMNDDISGADALLTENLPEICTNGVAIITYAIYVGQLNLTLLLLMLVCYPVILLISNVIVKKIVSLKKIHREKSDRITEIAQDCMSGVLVLRTFVAEDIFQAKLNQAANDLVSNEEKRARISNSAIIIRQMLQWLPNIICAVYAYVLVTKGNLSLGNLMAFLMILTAFVEAFVGLPFNFIDAKENGVCVSRIEKILSSPNEPSGTYTDFPAQKTGAKSARETNSETAQAADACTAPQTLAADMKPNAISFENVCFGYSADTPVLKNLSFSIKCGESVAFVGDSGGGKSTIFHILCGFYPINSGTYQFFGRDFLQWNVEAAREHMALVSQNVFLFPGTIYENVAYGNKSASNEDIINACKLARIHDFIESLPDKYNSIVGERGILLSGGEKQRISIARAILKDAPVLLLDEPTSAVDVATEHLIQEAIDNLSKNKTCITIAHRLSTIENVDRIMVLKNGNIVESGSHKELIEARGTYFDMYGREV